MFVKIDVVVPPVEEPVTLEELKRNLRVPDANDSVFLTDEDLQRKLIAARKRCEKFTRRSLISQTLDVWYNSSDGVGYLVLPRGKVQSVVAVTTYDIDNVATVADADIYDLVGHDLIFRDWLPYFRDHLGLKVRIVSGYGDYPEDVPEDLREGILEYATFLCDNPGGEGPEIKYQAQVTGASLPSGVLDKWKPYQLTVV